ncbi:MAG TPA: squalene synthase HpnC [Blastocatellia bacterium]|nr:squalene synthase HpnC [Blastocatellia bacterium]
MTAATQYTPERLAAAIDGKQITEKAWTVEAAYQYCARLARSHYENFPVGSVLIPRPLRRHFYSIYAFARTADDFADEHYGRGYSEQDRLDLLAEWGSMLRQSLDGKATHPVFIALTETRSQFSLPVSLFEDLISAFMQDVIIRRYQKFDHLLDYCRRSANPIGRLILLLFNYRDEQLHTRSDNICTALQLANHWQDVAVDLEKDRVYLPVEDAERFGVDIEDLRHHRKTDEAFRRLMQLEVGRARELFDKGKPLCNAVRGRLAFELRAVWLGGTRILKRLDAASYDVFSARPQLSSFDKAGILLSAINRRAFTV